MTKKTKTKPAKKLDNKTTTIAFVLDRSGSMASCKDDTIGGFNEYVKTLKAGKASDKSRFTMVQFDSYGIDTLYDDAKMEAVKPLTTETYVPRANTPLYDAIGKTIHRMLEAKAKDVLFTILTDGQENDSREYGFKALKDLMKECEDKHGWNFSFIGMGMDSWAAVEQLAVGTRSASNFIKISKDPKSIKRSFARAGGQSVAYACAITSDNAVDVQDLKANFWNKKDTKDNE